MQTAPLSPEVLLDIAVAAAMSGDSQKFKSLDDVPAPVYMTDADGIITFYNRACISFAGRIPELGKDRWCISWKIYNDDGDFIPHDKCPMAVAIQTRRPIRNASAVAERPDGSRVNFMPYPTPVFQKDGQFFGAVNVLIDISGQSNVVSFPGFEPSEPQEWQRLMRIFMSIKSKADRDHVLQIVERLAAVFRAARDR